MIRIRDDDVLIPSSGWSNGLGRLQQIHAWICEVPDVLIHVPTILITEIQQFPECIDFVRNEAAEGRMEPQVHGLKHIDYADLTPDEIKRDLSACISWIKEHLGVTPTMWYTPWGAGFDDRGGHLPHAAEEVGLKIVGTRPEEICKIRGQYGVPRRLEDGASLSVFDGKEIFVHWWEGGARLKRIVEVAKHGSWAKAKAAPENSELF